MQRRELGLVRHHKGQTGLYQGAILAPGIRNWRGGGAGSTVCRRLSLRSSTTKNDHKVGGAMSRRVVYRLEVWPETPILPKPSFS